MTQPNQVIHDSLQNAELRNRLRTQVLSGPIVGLTDHGGGHARSWRVSKNEVIMPLKLNLRR